MMKRILIIQDKILHYRKSLYNELSKHYHVTVLHSGSNTVQASDAYSEIITPVRKIGPFFLQSGVMRAITTEEYDGVIAMFDVRWLNNLMAWRRKRKKIDFVWWGLDFGKNRLASHLKLYICRRSNPTIFYTESTKNICVNSGVDANKLFVAHNTFHIEDRIKCYSNQIKDNILFVGTFDKRKQNDILITAFAQILDKIPKHINLILIGKGKEKNNMKELVANLAVDRRVIFEKEITRTEELAKFYKRAIVAVSFGQAGLAVLQSMGYGVPYLTKINAVTSGERSNITDKVNGILCSDDIESLKTKLLYACLNPEDSKRLGKNAFEHYTRYCTMENMARGFIEAINHVKGNG